MTSAQQQVHLLWLDDEIKKLLPYINALESEEFSVTTAVSTDEALQKLGSAQYSVVITDLLMPPPSSGISFLKTVHEQYPDLSLVVISGYLENDEYRRGLNWLEREMDVVLIEKPLPDPKSEAFQTIKKVLRGNITKQMLATEKSNKSSVQRIYEALEIKPGIFGLRFDVKKFLKKDTT